MISQILNGKPVLYFGALPVLTLDTCNMTGLLLSFPSSRLNFSKYLTEPVSFPLDEMNRIPTEILTLYL